MKNPLWDKLNDFEVSPGGDPLTFVGRLARENGWSARRAAQIYQEYLRFIYLAMVAGHPVTPSEDVDQAWHLHLCFSRSYWDDLCGCILKRPLHHGPTRGGKKEGIRYRDQYQRTLESYRTHFGEEPPGDIWPEPDKRFSPRSRHVRVNLHDSFVLPKKAVYLLGAVIPASFLLSGCVGLIGNALDGDIMSIILVVIGLLIVIRIAIWLIKLGGKGGGRSGGGCGGSGCGGSGCGGFFGGGGDSGCGGGGD